MKECIVELTLHSNQPLISWLLQTDDDRRFEVHRREEATVFDTPDAAVAAAETFLVEDEAKVDRSEQPDFPPTTYRVVRW